MELNGIKEAAIGCDNLVLYTVPYARPKVWIAGRKWRFPCSFSGHPEKGKQAFVGTLTELAKQLPVIFEIAPQIFVRLTQIELSGEDYGWIIV